MKNVLQQHANECMNFKKCNVGVGLQWHNVRTKFCENLQIVQSLKFTHAHAQDGELLSPFFFFP
jgi:hypothetical protein